MTEARPSWDSVDGLCRWPLANGRPILDGSPALLLVSRGEAGGDEARGEADASGVNARGWLSSESAPDEEGGTARMVERCAG